jgi:hypothetical protein
VIFIAVRVARWRSASQLARTRRQQSEELFLVVWGNASGRSRVPGTVSIRSHYGPNSDTGLCEVKARGDTVAVLLPTPVTQPRLAHAARGFFVKSAFTPAASFLRNAVMAAWRVAA